MDKSDCSFRQLPFSNLFNTYIENFEALSDFYSINPFDDQEVTNKANSISGYDNRVQVVEALKEFHTELGIQEEQIPQLEKFSNQDSLVFVTGQQLGIYGGPLFTVYKTITTIILARKWEEKLGRPVVPVFWLADEDHDFDEIASVGIPGYEDFNNIRIEQEGKGKPVSDEKFTPALSDLNESLKELLPETDFSEALWTQLTDSFADGKTYVQAFAQLMSAWFSKHGVLFVGSNFKPLKEILKDTIKTSITNRKEIHETLVSQSDAIAQQFHSQVVVGNTNLFYIDDTGARQKMDEVDGVWKVAGMSFSEEKLLQIVEKHPERFSPNVFLRPVMQDKLLPTVGYVAGPGELAYYGQMKMYYEKFEMEMPAIVPRLSITLIESGIERIMEKLPFPMCQYNMRIEDLERAYIEQSDSHDIDRVFTTWAESIKSSSESVLNLIDDIDPTLVKTSAKIISGFENEINKLKGRVFRSLKQQEETQLKRIAKIQSQVFPNGLQERSVSPIYFMNKHGITLWDEVLEYFESDSLNLQKHHIYPLS